MKYLAFIFVLLLSGCGTTEIITTAKEVKTPIAIACDPAPITKPDMPFDEQAKKSMTPLEKTQLLAAQDKNQKGYIIELEGALEGCTKLPDTK
jgi:hypothetical protein